MKSVHDPVSCNSASTTFSTREGQMSDGSSPRLPLFTWRLAPSSWAESVPSTLTKTSTWKWLPCGEFTWIDSMIQLQFCCMAEICVFWVKQPPQKTVVVVFMYVGMPPYYLNSVTISVQIDLGKDGQPGSDLRGAWLRPLQPTNWTETLRCHKTSFAKILRGRAAEVQAFNKVSNWAQTIYSSIKNQLALLCIVTHNLWVPLIIIQRLPE